METISEVYPLSSLTVDFLLGIPGETRADADEIRSFLERFSPGHVSAYILTLEQNTRLYDQVHRFGNVHMPGESEIIEAYKQFQKTMVELGYCQYEISSYFHIEKGALRSGKEPVESDCNCEAENLSIIKCTGKAIASFSDSGWAAQVH